MSDNDIAGEQAHVDDIAGIHIKALAGSKPRETYIGSAAKAKRELGYNPRPLREGMRETLEHEMKLLAAK